MTSQQAKNAMEFLKRADLKGVEVPAFVEVLDALEELANPKPAEPEAPQD